MAISVNPEAAGFDAARLERIDEHFRSAYVEPARAPPRKPPPPVTRAFKSQS